MSYPKKIAFGPKCKTSLLIFFANLLFVIPLFAQFDDAGRIDTTLNFGINFDHFTNTSNPKPGDGADDRILCMGQQSDGKIIIGGVFNSYNGLNNYLARINPDGSLDSTFNSGTGPSDFITAIEVLANDQILIAGNFVSYNGTSIRELARLNSDGSLDTSFDPGNSVNGAVYDIQPQANGKYIIGGSILRYQNVLVDNFFRVNSDGSLDLTFNSGSGISSTSGPESVRIIKELPNGQMYIAGTFNRYNNNVRNYILRINADGSIDNSFNPGPGIDASFTTPEINSMVILPDSSIIIGGVFNDYGNSRYDRLARLNYNGSLDNSFNPGGFGPDDDVRSLIMQADNKIIVGGEFDRFKSDNYYGVIRINMDGSLDPSFNVQRGLGRSSWNGSNATTYDIQFMQDSTLILVGNFDLFNGGRCGNIVNIDTSGNRIFDFNPTFGHDKWSDVLALQDDGKIYVGGSFESYNGRKSSRMVRLNRDGSTDLTFNMGEGFSHPISAVDFQTDGKIIVGGAFDEYDDTTSNRIIRLFQNGRIDHSFNIGTGADNRIESLIVLPNDKILISGAFSSFNGVNAGRIARLNSDGSLDNTFNSGVGANTEIRVMVLQNDGKIIIGGPVGSYNGTIVNRLARLNTDGTLDTSFSSGSGPNSIWRIDIQDDNKILIGPSITTYNGTPVNRFARINTDGSLDTTFNTGSGPNQNVWGLKSLPDKKILIAGNFTQYNGTPVSGIARLDSSGSLDSSFDPGSGPDDIIYQVRIDEFGKIVMVGELNSYDGIPRNGLVRIRNKDCAGSTSFGSETISACDSFDWAVSSQKYTTSGNYISVINNASGCDSIVTLDLTINASNSAFDTVIACGSYTWPANNQTFTSSGDYVAMFTNSFGCDSVFNLSLTFPVDSVNEFITDCDSFTWTANNTTYNRSGIYQTTLTNSNGCDSLVTLNLTINNSINTTDSITSCNSYTWAATNQTYITPGNYNAQLTNQFGCDSLVTLVLDLNYSDTTSESASSCVNYVWPVNNQNYSNSGIYSAVLTDRFGCDSIVNLNLTILQPSSSTIQVSSCGNYTAPDGQIYNIDGTYTAIIPNQFGCDSIITINLTIVPAPSFNAINIVPPSCNTSADGEALIVPASGIPPYVVIWNGPSTHTGLIQDELEGGVYLVTMIDGNGCQVVDSVVIPFGPEISGTFQVNDATCGNFDGSIDLSVNGGSGPYTYQWNNGDFSEDPDSLSAGVYSVTVNDQNGCESILSTTVNSIGGAQINLVNADDVSCFGATDGSIDVSITGNYQTLIWSNGAITEDISGLQSGPYQLIVADSLSNCISLFDININEPDPININVNTSLADCDSANGSAIAQVSGGNGGYTIVWSTGVGGPSVNSLAAGNYSVFVTDSRGCTTNQSFVISESGGPQVIIDSIVSGYCNTISGSIYLSSSSPNGPLTYQWSNSASTEDLINVPYGQYSLEVQDQNSCETLLDFNLRPQNPNTPEICLVSVDSAINSNTVIWDISQTESYYNEYTIWRESSVQNVYQQIGRVAASDPGFFVDSISNPLVRAFRYKISVNDTCNLESNQSESHRTIHLIQNNGLQSNSVNLIWSHYAGLDFTTYEIFRNSTQNGWEFITTLSAAQNSYTDIPSFNIANDSALFYAVIAQSPNNCNITGSASTNRMWSNASSTLFNPNSSLGRSISLSERISIYPNPSSGIFLIEIPENENRIGLRIYDILGSLQFSDIIYDSQYILDFREKSTGLYLMHFDNGSKPVIKRIVKD